jgi:hypothetical protein
MGDRSKSACFQGFTQILEAVIVDYALITHLITLENRWGTGVLYIYVINVINVIINIYIYRKMGILMGMYIWHTLITCDYTVENVDVFCNQTISI